MILNIILKELQENFHTIRFYLIVFLTIFLFVTSSLIFVQDHGQKVLDYRNDVSENENQIQQRTNQLYRLAKYNQSLIKKPNPYSLLSEANEKFLPSRIKSNIFHLDFPEVQGRGNILLRDYKNVDWEFIVAIVMSFLAFVLSYDAICGEKQQNTLSLIFSNSIKTSQVYIGKILGLFFTLLIPFLIGVFLGLIIVGINGNVSFNYTRIVFFGLASIIYLLLFLLIGITVSSIFTRTITSAISLLFIWVVVAFVIPASGNLIAPRLSQVPKKSEVFELIERTQDDIYRTKYAKTEAGNWNGDHFAPWVPLRAQWMEDNMNARNRIFDDYIQKMVRQVEKTKDVLRVSPVSVFRFLAEEISGTGVNRFKYFYDQTNRFKRQLYDFVEIKDNLDPNSNHYLELALGIDSGITRKPVDFSSVPRFEEKLPAIRDNINQIVWDLSILIFLSVLLFYVGYILFIRYDKR